MNNIYRVTNEIGVTKQLICTAEFIEKYAKKTNSTFEFVEEVSPFAGMDNKNIQEKLLNTEKNISFLDEKYTVNEADLLFNKLLASNDIDAANSLSAKIITATNDIITRYPIEGQNLLTQNSFFKEIINENTALKSKIKALNEQAQFHEDLITELVIKIYE